MKIERKVISLVACLYIAVSLVSMVSVFGYSAAESIEQSEEYSEIKGIENEILRQMEAFVPDNTDRSGRAAFSIDFSKAAKVYTFDANDLQVSGKSVSSSALSINAKSLSNQAYSWKVPLAADTGYIYTTITVNNGQISYETTETSDFSLGQASYLFEPGLVSDIIQEADMASDSFHMVTLPIIKTDFACFAFQDVQYVIPFASRPDFLEVENGQVYEYDEFILKVSALLDEMQADDMLSGGGGNIGKSNNIKLAGGILLAAFAAVGLIVFRKKEKNN